jgi:uncharacterized protein YcsI (UPF0317 family)
VGFLLGCSFSFESALISNGIRLRHIEQKKNVAMYRTNRPCETRGMFAGPLVVSMRPILNELVPQVVEITGRVP